MIRADRGTENGNIEMMQTYLRSINRDTRSSLHATFLYGKSTAYQRIEAWWSKFQPQGMLYWMNHFKELSDAGIFDRPIVVSSIAVFRLVDNILSSSLHC